MKKLKPFIFIFFFTVLFFSCRKELKPVPASTPVFSFKGTMGDLAVQLNAGDGDTVMSTDKIDWHGEPVVSGTLGATNNFVSMKFYSGDVDLPSINSKYLTLMQLNGAYFPDGHFATLNKTQFSNSASLSKLSWELDNEDMNNDLLITDPGIYDIQASVQFANGTDCAVSNRVIVGYISHQLFNLSISVSNQMISASIISSAAIDSVSWSIGSNIIDTAVGTQLYTSILSSEHYLTAVVYFHNGTTRTRTLAFDSQSTDYVLQDYVYMIESASQNLALDYKTEIQLSVNGTNYLTSKVENQNDNMVTIYKKEQYVDSLTGKKAVKLTGNINAKFKKMGSNDILTGNFDFVLAFPYDY